MIERFSNISAHHGFTTRHGGVSLGVYSTMNTSFFGDDERHAVFKNIKRVLDAIKCDAKIIIATQQVHSNTICIIDEMTRFDPFISVDLSGTALEDYQLYIVKETDGLITKRSDVVLMTFYADCVPLLFHDPLNGWVGTVHSGWKGTANFMATEAIRTFAEVGAEINHLKIAIGPCASVCCYEVDQKVYDAFDEQYTQAEMEQIFNRKDKNHYWLDLKLANKIQLINLNIREDSIEIHKDCTICQPDKYHSHRRTGYPRGSLSAFIQTP